MQGNVFEESGGAPTSQRRLNFFVNQLIQCGVRLIAVREAATPLVDLRARFEHSAPPIKLVHADSKWGRGGGPAEERCELASVVEIVGRGDTAFFFRQHDSRILRNRSDSQRID